ncbi:MAG: ATP-binding cassette domain-containing protein [Syntrophomonadaceae bacterium]|nr:ATP-binding cassette domain-containing protein [Syntrophomonadaceae bacterium]
MNEMIELLDVTKEYNYAIDSRICALKNISLTIRQGELIGIVGINGSGKTTLARLLNGLILPTSGRVLVNGMDTTNPCYRKGIRRLVGMVFQNPDNQIINPIVEEEVAFGAQNLNLSPAEVSHRVDWALHVVGLMDLRHHAPHLLSGGQKQRLAVAAALAMRPTYLGLDEPTSMLDQVGRRELIRCLEELSREHRITVILISHCMEEVARADRLIVLHHGAVHLDGPPWEVFSSSDFTLTGLKPPPIARLTNILLRQGNKIDKKIVALEQMVEFLCR